MLNDKFGFKDQSINKSVKTKKAQMPSKMISLLEFERLTNSNRMTGKFIPNENFLDGYKSLLIHKNGPGF